jgi:membrane-bound lytic murein transglycosylase D
MRINKSLFLTTLLSCLLWHLIPNISLANDPEFDETSVIDRIKIMTSDVVQPRYTSVVKGYLKGYTVWNRAKSERILGRALLYFPIFEQYLKEHNLPNDLKYLSVVESALDPKAISRAGAIGLWQFMPETAKEMGLKITNYVDERQDPHKSTDAALRYLKRQYNRFGSWELALAAYNGGSGRVSRAMKRARSDNFWVVQRYLPTETRNYIPAFIAACYLGKHYDDHHILPNYPDLDLQITETITIYSYLTFIRLQHLTGLSTEEIELLNPCYIKGFIPSNVLGNPLTLPKRVMPVVKQFLKNNDVEQELADSFMLSKRIEHLAGFVPEKEDFYAKGLYSVGAGETLTKLATSFDVSPYLLAAWNGLKYDAKLKQGQELWIYRWDIPLVEEAVIPVRVSVARIDELPTKPVGRIEEEILPPNTFRRDGYLYYVVKAKETLSDIATRFNGVTISDIMILNNFRGTQIPEAGREIKIKKLTDR